MKPDLVCFTETWLHDGTSTDCINISGYNLIYKNRTSGIHGGVCTYIRNSIKFKTLNFLHHPDFEVLWVYVRPKRLPRGVPCIVIGTVYHPPSADDNCMIDYLSLSLTSIEGYYPGCGIFLTRAAERGGGKGGNLPRAPTKGGPRFERRNKVSNCVL